VLQRAGGRLTVRERIERMLDAGSFHEIGATAGRATYDADSREIAAFMLAACVFGRRMVDGHPVVICRRRFRPARQPGRPSIVRRQPNPPADAPAFHRALPAPVPGRVRASRSQSVLVRRGPIGHTVPLSANRGAGKRMYANC
jgi:hypothetical protein